MQGEADMTNQRSNRELEPREKQELATEGTRPGHVFRPDVDILERSDAYVVVADLPGANENSIDIRLEKGVLSLDARLAHEAESEWRPIHSEYREGAYHREFRISEDIDPSGVSAKMKEGVLELHLPKSAESQPRTITVQTS